MSSYQNNTRQRVRQNNIRRWRWSDQTGPSQPRPYKPNDSLVIPPEVIKMMQDNHINGNEAILLSIVRSHTHYTNWEFCQLSQAQLGKAIGVRRVTINRMVQKLKDMNLLERCEYDWDEWVSMRYNHPTIQRSKLKGQPQKIVGLIYTADLED